MRLGSSTAAIGVCREKPRRDTVYHSSEWQEQLRGTGGDIDEALGKVSWVLPITNGNGKQRVFREVT